MKVDQTVMQFRLESAYYENFSDFSSAIYGCLNDADLKHKKQLDSLLTLGFQKFNKSQIMNVQSI
ncbi:conserved hypothetical protein [Microcystis aeruginosa PCC 9432]|jgi:hypothetical protein|uniref:Uncharacterized protein n=4 Tax=Microcystis aeruginosa TaxID=1126 RepID=S3JW31_MICAE|nr:hypothetical protein MAESPC_04809 [Microcystis aeruginosa SPC777]OCY14728.1 MAG: transposase [Microcystis aeruginosa CACIAM 03]CCH91295.1 conserved hypothetical protein [Microcystis aeruginosa PCC 9432]GBD52374.1 hypothetical protein BGM30_14670 [Microcystis aeruginosa NIES-298]GCE58908.1 hypothetical protein MiAbB_00818 [Microcystis aeruginosa NIES-4285]